MRPMAQNLLKGGYKSAEGEPLIPFALTQKVDIVTRWGFDTALRNAKSPVMIDEVDLLLENKMR